MVMIVSVCEFIRVPFGREAAGCSRLGIVGTHPSSFRKSGKQRGCRIRNLEEDTEDGRGGERGKDGSYRTYEIGVDEGGNSRPIVSQIIIFLQTFFYISY